MNKGNMFLPTRTTHKIDTEQGKKQEEKEKRKKKEKEILQSSCVHVPMKQCKHVILNYRCPSLKKRKAATSKTGTKNPQ